MIHYNVTATTTAGNLACSPVEIEDQGDPVQNNIAAIAAGRAMAAELHAECPAEWPAWERVERVERID